MKVTIIIHYAGQKQSFTNIEFDDDSTWEDISHDFTSSSLIDAINEETNEEIED